MSGPLVSVVVPTLQEERALPPLLDHLDALPGRFEVIVSDGGSDDGTRRIARERGARLIAAPRGRAAQMNAGARVCSGSIIVFLHADTRLPMTAYGSLARAARRGVCGGNFALRFDGGGLFSAFLGAVYRKQRALRVFYGDSAIWATRETFARLGGFPEQPIMEDLEFARALLRTGRAARLPGPAVTSSRRWRGAGVVRTVATWVLIRYLYLGGVPPERLAALYRVVR